MASPPFAIAETVPADDDIVSAFPAAERTFRDVVEDWLLFEHGVSGHHTFDYASTATLDADTTWEVGSIRFNSTLNALELCTAVGPVTFGLKAFMGATAAAAFTAVKQAATDSATGVVELATQAEAEAGASSSVVPTALGVAQAITALTPAAVPAASTTTAGKIEIATAAEVITATDTALAVTPGDMKSHPGVAKAWVNFNGDSGAVIGSSHNVTSVVRNSVGNYTITWSVTFSDTTYAIIGTARGAGGGNDDLYLRMASSDTKSTTATQVRCIESSGSNTVDSPEVNVMVFGTLA